MLITKIRQPFILEMALLEVSRDDCELKFINCMFIVTNLAAILQITNLWSLDHSFKLQTENNGQQSQCPRTSEIDSS